MRILLDECIDEHLRHEFAGHECQTARFAGFSGLQNGRLLDAAEAAGFEVIATIDQNIPYQQNLGNRQIAILIFKAPTNRLVDLVAIMPEALRALSSMKLGEIKSVWRINH